jgi:hypothetical protein
MIKEYDKQEVLSDLKMYLALSYVNNNMLIGTLENIENKVSKKDVLSNTDIQKVTALVYYIDGFRVKRVGFNNAVYILFREHEQEVLDARNECGKLLLYNDNIDTKINFENIRGIMKVFKELEGYAKYRLEKNVGSSIDNITNEFIKDDNLFNMVKQYLKEIIK